MDQYQITDETVQAQPPQEAELASPREWVEPTFEQMTLNDAMNGVPGTPSADGYSGYS